MRATFRQGTVVYDGGCAFCRRQVERMRRRDTARCFEYVPRQTTGLEQRFPQLAEGDFETGMRLVMPDGRVMVGADAVYHIVRALPRWRWLSWLYRVPGLHLLSRMLYRWVAANRQSLGRACPEQSCGQAGGIEDSRDPGSEDSRD